MTKGEDRTVRQIAAHLVREWAERRLTYLGGYSGNPIGAPRETKALTHAERRLFEDCADDIERGLP